MSTEILVAIIGFATGIIGLLAAFVGRRKHITNRQEVVHRQETVQIQKGPEFVARCHDCGRGIRAGQGTRKTVEVGKSRQWKRGFMGIGGRWEEIKQYATVDLCASCAGTRAVLMGLAIVGGVVLVLIFLAYASARK